MAHEGKDKIQDSHFPGEIELYGDPGIATFDAKVPKFLLWTYTILPIWGIITFYYFWNGSYGWFDRGSWHELQIAANTTFPIENQNMLPEEKKLKEQTDNSVR
ncbi:hypothetical protein [Candidatus Protochlamydia phocaeensis]|uniref:hypothetical protein n=1 Tax=Candidatus Protochlamydia phocaeensis TaxID=1414722 RepID=UPI000837FEB8|nr:hypothetical protein [Candidatus Protochlamydia phocaeensis]